MIVPLALVPLPYVLGLLDAYAGVSETSSLSYMGASKYALMVIEIIEIHGCSRTCFRQSTYWSLYITIAV